MYRTLLLLVFPSVFSLNAISQQAPPVADTLRLDDGRVFTNVDIDASFPGGADAWIEYLRKNLNARVPVKKKAPEGSYTVIVRFFVAKDGSLSDIVAETNHGYGMEQELMRIIKKGPKWKPASRNGRFVKAYRRQPITFVVRGR